MSSRRKTAFLTVEFLASLVLVTTILVLFAHQLTQFARLSDVLLVRQRTTLAAEAVLNEIRSGHEPMPAELSARFSGLTFEIRRQSGSGAWDGQTRVTVDARGTASGGVPVRVTLSGYVREVSR